MNAVCTPHTLVEGVIISSYAIGVHTAFIYVRGEVLHVIRRVQQAVQQARDAGYLGTNILGSGFDLEVVVHAGAGAYICGEETALLDSLEGAAVSPGCVLRSRPSPGCTRRRRSSTTLRRLRPCRASSPTARTGSARWARRSRR